MKKLIFKDAEYAKINVTKVPDILQEEIDKLSFDSGNCLYNSYMIAKNIANTNIVEGYLVTYFEDGSDIESVGHAWNEYNGAYFDKSIELVKHNRKIKKNVYFLTETYTATIASKKKVYFPQKSMYDLIREEDTSKSKLVFKTDVKKNELELKNQLNKKKDNELVKKTIGHPKSRK